MSDKNSVRGNSKKLFPQRAMSSLRRNYFTVRAARIWNSLPENVISAPNTNCFKNRLDKFWENQDIIYNYRADISI